MTFRLELETFDGEWEIPRRNRRNVGRRPSDVPAVIVCSFYFSNGKLERHLFFFGWLCFYGNDSKRERERERERKRSGSGRPTKKSSRNESVRLSTAASSLVLRFFLNLFSAHPFSFRQKKNKKKKKKTTRLIVVPFPLPSKRNPVKKFPLNGPFF